MQLEDAGWDVRTVTGCGGVTWAGDTHLADTAPGAPPLSSCWNAGPGARPGCSRRSLDVEQREFRGRGHAGTLPPPPRRPRELVLKKSSRSEPSEIKEFPQKRFLPVPRRFATTKPWNIPRAEQAGETAGWDGGLLLGSFPECRIAPGIIPGMLGSLPG